MLKVFFFMYINYTLQNRSYKLSVITAAFVSEYTAKMGEERSFF